MPEISILTPDGRTRAVPLQGDRLGLGRAGSNELCFPEDTGLSRQHLVFEREGDTWVIRDPGSKNGTHVNGTRIESPRRLSDGDEVCLGAVVLTFRVATTIGTTETLAAPDSHFADRPR